MPRIRVWNPRNPSRGANPSKSPQQTNPKHQGKNPSQTRTELLAQIRELREENDDLQDQLDKIAGLAEAPDDQDSETIDDLKEKLNHIADAAAPSDEDNDDTDNEDTDEDDSGND